MRLGLNIEVITVDLWISTRVRSAKRFASVTFFFLVSSLPRHLQHVKEDTGCPHAEQGRFCLGAITVFRHLPPPRSWQQKHIRTRETNTNSSRQPSSCTHSWHSHLCSSSSPTTRHLLRLHWFRSNSRQVQQLPDTRRYLRWLRQSKRRSKRIDTSASVFSQFPAWGYS